jgi:hypothetical protein
MLLEAATFILEKIGEELIGDSYKEVKKKLLGDPAKKALSAGLARAVRSYVSERRPYSGQILLREDGPLSDSKVLAEIARFSRFDGEPDPKVIATSWSDAAPENFLDLDYDQEARELLRYIKRELRQSEILRPIFDSKSLEVIREDTKAISESVRDLPELITSLRSFLASPYMLARASYFEASVGVQQLIINSTREIEEKTRNFVGRKFVFDKFCHFLASEESGYFFLFGERGIGKTSVAAQLIRENGYVHHFNKASSGINSPTRFAENICAQLIARYGLRRDAVPTDFRDNAYLMSLLKEVSEKTQAPNVIVVDAIDEVTHERSAGTNLLFLPEDPPPNTYFFVTSSEVIHIRMCNPPDDITIKASSKDNKKDIRDYLDRFVGSPEVSATLGLTSEADKQKFVTTLAVKADGNFMYLHYVLPELLRTPEMGAKVDKLPKGLKNYYDDHWDRMRKKSEHWTDRALPVIAVLTASRCPIDLATIFKHSGLEKRGHVLEVLTDLASFIRPQLEDDESTKLFQIYHQSFVEFLETKPEIRDELERVRDQMVDRESDFLE